MKTKNKREKPFASLPKNVVEKQNISAERTASRINAGGSYLKTNGAEHRCRGSMDLSTEADWLPPSHSADG
ncbi:MULTISPECIES: hypothetical protein [Geobacillus]|uniref:hypothetical protein n=1 Tax=Geobacillus TaxID=129337 RepID=UPI0004DF4EA8|nr:MULTISPECIES: hypothetical protein [Geobacillus]